MKKLSLIVLFSLLFGGLYAQKKVLIEDYKGVVEAAKTALDESMKAPDGSLWLFATKHQISGTFELTITIHEKGKVLTVFVKKNDGGSIKSQNMLKDFLMEQKFNFKMPKGNDYKFDHSFQFN
ncbi:MAG: hypothetical protein PHG67_12855 [Bacteroidales bacterium]|jgi:hypothetical protein|nr:hypothetical protein [Bacteroidales bacterium]HOI32441.1 hypothetical protein [Bacteroidales bacterium]